MVSDFSEPLGQDVEQETADELDAIESDGPTAAPEGDVGVRDLSEAVVGDGDALDVAGDLLGDLIVRPR